MLYTVNQDSKLLQNQFEIKYISMTVLMENHEYKNLKRKTFLNDFSILKEKYFQILKKFSLSFLNHCFLSGKI